MPDITKNETPARKILPLIYVIDNSGSMKFDPIGSVNEAMYGTVDLIKDIARRNPDAEIKLGILTFATGAHWVTHNTQTGEPGLIYAEDFFWNDLDASGLTDIGEALSELDEHMSRHAFFTDEVGYKLPVLIFMSDGEPTDDWKSALAKIDAGNKWFHWSTKICVAVGEDADRDVLAHIAGRDGRPNYEAVIAVNDLEALKELIKVVSVTASKIGSVSRVDGDVQGDIVRSVREQLKGEAGIEADDNESSAGCGKDDAKKSVGDDAAEGWDDSWDD